MISMLFLGVGMVLSRGWLNDFQSFVKSRVGGDSGGPGGVTPTNTPQTTETSNPASQPATQIRPGGGGGSW